MKKQNLTIIIAAVVFLLGAIGAFYVISQKNAQIESLSAENTNLDQTIMNKDSVVNDLASSFDEIENSLKFIQEKRNQLAIPEDQENGKTQKESILADIDLMNTMLEESSVKIDELEAKLKQSGLNISNFEKRITALNDQVEKQNSEIADLRNVIEQKDFQIADLNTKVNDLNMTVAENLDTIKYKEQVILNKDDELNTGHVAYGTYKELRDMGVLTKEGGILGIGASKTIEENFDDEYFTTLDTREVNVIPLHAKKATVVSEHPKDSYELVQEGDQIAYLQIDNPDEFWKISKYAVIEVK